jgi:hypothetical protein
LFIAKTTVLRFRMKWAWDSLLRIESEKSWDESRNIGGSGTAQSTTKIMLFQGMHGGFTGIIITAANRKQIVRRCLLKFGTQFRRKKQWFSLISLAQNLFPLKHFRKHDDSILHSSPKQFVKASFDL